MDKKQYFKLSLEQGLPNRCPIIEYCERHAWTIYFFSDFSSIDYHNNYIQALHEENILPKDFEKKRISLKSEPPTWSKGNTGGSFYNMCPEVNLFDPDNRLGFVKKLACTDGIWDVDFRDEFKILETKHYSECLEFSNYLFENKFQELKKTSRVKNKACFVYLMIDNKTGHYKIGISNNPKYREKTLRSEDPDIQTLSARKLVNRSLARNLEKKLHQKFNEKKVRGEWFDLTPTEVNQVISILNE